MIDFIATIISFVITFWIGFMVLCAIAGLIGGIFNLLTGRYAAEAAAEKDRQHKAGEEMIAYLNRYNT